MATKICFETTLAGFPIRLEQRGREAFVVTYGQQVDKGDYEHASRKLGQAIMHALACEGRLDNRERGER
jgi:hypothetical protein